jgi:hypothetical protein
MVAWKCFQAGKRMNVDIPSDFSHFEIETPDGVLEFDGKLLGVIDNERRGRPRWAEIELYKYLVTDTGDPGQQAYLLHTMGHSVVYHAEGSHCNRGVAVPVEEFRLRAEFPDDLEPCADTLTRGNVTSKGCHPADWRDAPAGTLFELEVLRHTKIICPTAEDALDWLRRPSKVPCGACESRGVVMSLPCPACHGRGFTATGKPVLTAPGQRLVEIARFRDPDIERAVGRTVKL